MVICRKIYSEFILYYDCKDKLKGLHPTGTALSLFWGTHFFWILSCSLEHCEDNYYHLHFLLGALHHDHFLHPRQKLLSPDLADLRADADIPAFDVG